MLPLKNGKLVNAKKWVHPPVYNHYEKELITVKWGFQLLPRGNAVTFDLQIFKGMEKTLLVLLACLVYVHRYKTNKQCSL